MEKRRGRRALTTPIKLRKCFTTSNIVGLEFKTTISDETIKKKIITIIKKRRRKKERRRNLQWKGEEGCDEYVTQERKEKGEEDEKEGIVTDYMNTLFSPFF